MARLVAATLLILSAMSGAAPASSPPPMPARAAEPAAAPDDTRTMMCPRCGYRCDAGWRHCLRCGWDLRTLAGDAAARALIVATKSTHALIVIKQREDLLGIVPPQYRKYVRFTRQGEAMSAPGREKFFATAFPFLRPGLFVTSARALERGVEAQLRSYDNHIFKAEILGYDTFSGLGVVRAEVPGIAPLSAGDSEGAALDRAWAVCYPYVSDDGIVTSLPVSLHAGRISATAEAGTSPVSLEALLQSDHSLPMGCWGGPLVDPYGVVAGLILDRPTDGVAYALPIAPLTELVDRLARKEHPVRPFFGLGLVRPEEPRTRRFGLPADPGAPIVAYLAPGSPAAAAGVQPGDLLTAVGGDPVHSVADAVARLLRAEPGGPPVQLTVSRAGTPRDIGVGPAVRPEQVLLAPSDEIQEALEGTLSEVSTGPTWQQGLRIEHLVPGGRGAQDGYKEGDTIVAVDGKPMRRFATFDATVRDGNRHVFADAPKEGGNERPASMYALRLEVHPQAGGREERFYVNRFPNESPAPVY